MRDLHGRDTAVRCQSDQSPNHIESESLKMNVDFCGFLRIRQAHKHSFAGIAFKVEKGTEVQQNRSGLSRDTWNENSLVEGGAE